MKKSFIISALTFATGIFGVLSFVNSNTSTATKLDQIGLANLQALTTSESGSGNNEPNKGFRSYKAPCYNVPDDVTFILSGNSEFHIEPGCISGSTVFSPQLICEDEGPLKTCTPYKCDKFIEDVRSGNY